jgi:VanZ family protein
LRYLFWSYLIFLIVLALLPLNGASSVALNHVHIIRIRLDYLIHSVLFIPWVFLYIHAFRPVKWQGILLMICLGLLAAFTAEWVQYFLTYRTYNINDLLSNFLGVLLGAIILFRYPVDQEEFPG